MKNALGKLRDYLAKLFGEDRSDKEKARQTTGIDLSALSDKSDIEAALSMKADKTGLENQTSKDVIDSLEQCQHVRPASLRNVTTILKRMSLVWFFA